MTRWLTYRAAARRVGRSRNTIRRWHRDGMPMATDNRGRRVVSEAVLLDWWRRRLLSDPVARERADTGDVDGLTLRE